MAITQTEIVRACFRAYEEKDRQAIEELIADDFHFTSPNDNRIDRGTYFEKCWPNSEQMASFSIQRMLTDGDHVSVVYELHMKDGRSFRNSELHTVRNGKVTDVEVYFGWSIPHQAPSGGFLSETDERIGNSSEPVGVADRR